MGDGFHGERFRSGSISSGTTYIYMIIYDLINVVECSFVINI
jgi:hypothetical protein